MARYEVLEQLPLEQLVCLALSSSSCVEQSSQISQNQGAYRKDQKEQKRRLCWTRAAHTLQGDWLVTGRHASTWRAVYIMTVASAAQIIRASVQWL
ncbi:g6189 [Coccomyxa viridis]|uniref:G6189 protein n=1 Tax=Coccomyxa viridis TaxID=1274662 RepID=A0ABP1FUS2_9CHLO